MGSLHGPSYYICQQVSMASVVHGNVRIVLPCSMYQGGYGRVWKALMKKNQKCYALKEMSKAKIIDKKSVSSIVFERNLLSEMNHP